MNYYNEIKNKLIDNEVYSKVRDYSKERNKVITYFEIGKLLNEAGGKYGDNIIEEYSKKLILEVGKRYNKRTLFRMRQFYNIFSDKKLSTLSTQLSWSHYCELLPIRDINKLYYYLETCINQKIDVRTLRNKIKSNEYERLPKNGKNKLLKNEEIEIKDYFKNMITNDKHILLCYEVNNEVIGYIYFKYIENDDGKGYLIDGLYVEEQYRNKGIAKELMQFGLNESKKRNIDFIDIKVMYQNKIALKLYESFGFNILSLQMRKK